MTDRFFVTINQNEFNWGGIPGFFIFSVLKALENHTADFRKKGEWCVLSCAH